MARLGKSVGERGLSDTAKELGGLARRRWVRMLRSGRETVFDAVHGVDTRGLIPAHELGHADSDAVRYEVTPWRRGFRRTVRSLGLPYDEFTFVDVGCGKGRILLLAAAFPFRRVVGVELSAGLAETARANVTRFRNGRGAAAPVEVVECDATEYELPEEPLLLYLYNPFKGSMLARFLENVERSLERQPRRIVILYMQPEAREAFDAAPFLEERGAGERYVIYSSLESRTLAA